MDTPVKILVVEDEMLIGAKISRLLTNMGYEIPGLLPRGEEVMALWKPTNLILYCPM